LYFEGRPNKYAGQTKMICPANKNCYKLMELKEVKFWVRH